MSIDKSKIYIVIPAFNEAKVIADVISKIKQEGFNKIIVVDDGSLDETFEVASKTGVTVLKHLINRGKGAATQTGLDAAKLLNAEIVVTIDADGQHHEKDIIKLIQPISDGQVDVALGSRFLEPNKIPTHKVFMNKIANIITYLFFGLLVNDSQSGFRAYNRKAIDMIYTDMDRYEYESQILGQINIHKLKYIEVPIKVNYTEYSQGKYKDIVNFRPQNFTNGLNMLFKMILRSIFS